MSKACEGQEGWQAGKARQARGEAGTRNTLLIAFSECGAEYVRLQARHYGWKAGLTLCPALPRPGLP